MPYLFCENCDIFYEVLSKDERKQCECGSELTFYESLEDCLYKKGKIKKNTNQYFFQELISFYESFLARIILHCVKESTLPLNSKQIFHIIHGTKSDFIKNNHLNELYSYSILPNMTEREFELVINSLVKKSFLIIDELTLEDCIVLTEAGDKFLWDSNNINLGFNDELRKMKEEPDSEHPDEINLPFRLLNDPKGPNRAHIAYLLGETRDPKYVDVLCKATQDSNGNVRIASASALGKIGEIKAENSLIELLKDPKQQARTNAVRALGKLNSKKGLSLIKNMKTDESPYVVREVELVLSKSKKNSNEFELLDTPKIFKSSESQKNDKSVSFEKSKETSAIDIDESSKITSILLYDPNSNKRAQAAYNLGNIQEPKYVDVLCKATQDNSANVRRLAVVALGKIGDKRAEDTFIKLLKDPEPYTRQYAIVGLGKIHSKKGLPYIKELTKDSVLSVRQTAYKTIAMLNKT